MTLCTAYLLREPTTIECIAGKLRHPQSVKCRWYDQTYAMDYESSCSDLRDLATILEGAQVLATSEHVSGHRNAKVEFANRIPPQAAAS